jgi:hypothetical protein
MRSIRRMAVALAACAIVVGAFGASSASAATVKPCTGSGTLYVTPSGDPLHPYLWHVEGSGTCPAVLQLPLTPTEPQRIAFAGSGTSDTLGLCDGSILVRQLALNVLVRYVNVVTGAATTEQQYWHAGFTTYPVVTPYIISARPNSGPFGLGLILHHILLGCGNNGTMPSATYAWVGARREGRLGGGAHAPPAARLSSLTHELPKPADRDCTRCGRRGLVEHARASARVSQVARS